MVKYAYFFHNDNLLLPAGFPDSQLERGVPLENINDFINAETFEISQVDDFSASGITVVSAHAETALPANWKSINIRQLIALYGIDNNKNLAKIIRACHITQWRSESRFCGTCGAKNNEISKEGYRACPSCGRLEFPRICPAVITLITDSGNRILLAHNKRFKNGVYSHISGFNEAGETLEDTVAREIREEVNIGVCNIEYVKSQPWPFPNSLMIGFKARYLSGTIRPDGEEIEDAKWFTKDNMPEIPAQGSLSRFMIDEWLGLT